MRNKTILILLLITNILTAQENFEWMRKGFVQKTKGRIYSDTKEFISQTFKSSKAVIDNDDKEAGIISIKPVFIHSATRGGHKYTYIYRYSLKFRMKDDKYMVTIDNVYCDEASGRGGPIKIEPFEGKCNISTWDVGIVCKKAIPMMNLLKNQLHSILNSYEKYIAQKSVLNDDW